MVGHWEWFWTVCIEGVRRGRTGEDGPRQGYTVCSCVNVYMRRVHVHR